MMPDLKIYDLAPGCGIRPPSPTPTTPDLKSYDWIVVNSSAGKDSQAMLDYVVEQCDLAGVSRERIVVVHADLGRMEWKGTKELAKTQADHYNLVLEIVSRKGSDLLERVQERKKWPDSARRWCTSDFKRGPISTIHTMLARRTRDIKGNKYRVSILNCLGMRAQESPTRAKLPVFEPGDCGRRDKPTLGTNGVKRIDAWHAIHGWTVKQVWDRIRRSGVPHHAAYDLGMPRLSCVFCIFSTRNALLLAGKHNPELLDQYVAVEEETGHDFRNGFKLGDVRRDLAAGVVPGPVQDWTM